MSMIAVVPVLLLGIVVTILSYIRFTNTIYEQTKIDMRNVANSVKFTYDSLYEGNYVLVKDLSGAYNLKKGNATVSGDNSIVDGLSAYSDSEISLIYSDTRINTTFKTPGGERYVGVGTNAETSARVLAGEELFYDNVEMFDDKYLVLYVPLSNDNDEIVGMIEIARSSSDIRAAVFRAVWPIIILTIIGMLVTIFISFRSTSEITKVLKKLQIFMNKVAGGSLNTELDTDVLKRTDELGDISKSATSMQKSIRSFVETDPLTQLGNRRYVKNMLNKVKERYKETGQPFSIALGDIDFFKKVNDTYGHNAGDEVLKAVAATLKSMMNGKGFAARWGGEEFIMVFDRMAMYDSADWLWKILGKIREMTVEADGFEIKVTMTFGVVTGRDTNSETLVEAADEKLYYGKQNGRNQVVVDLPGNSDNINIEEVEMKKFEGYQKGINFGGWLSQCNHTFERYENFIKEEDFKHCKDLGFDHIRVPVDYNAFQNEDGSPREGGIEYVNRAVEYAGKYGLNMVLDLHKTAGFFFHEEAHESGFFEDEALQERFYKLWENFAKLYGSLSDRVAFELLNEVTDKAYMPTWIGIMEKCVKRIRKYAPDTYILLGGYWNNAVTAVKDLPLPFDDKIVYNFHCYEPIIFTHQTAHWVKGLEDYKISYPDKAGFYASESKRLGVSVDGFDAMGEDENLNTKYFEKLFESAIKTAAERNVPLYCGEYGVIDMADTKSTIRWLKDITAVLDKYDIGRALWSYRSMNFGFVGEHYDDIRDEMVNCM